MSKVVSKVESFPLQKIFFDSSIYPRTTINFKTTTTYGYAMRAGAIFPPITVATVEGKRIIIDGAHRFNAAKFAGKEKIETISLGKLTKKDAYREAVKRNISNSLPFSLYEKLQIYKRLHHEGLTLDRIAGILYIPKVELKRYVSQRITSVATGEEVLKAPLKHLIDQGTGTESDDQKKIAASSQVNIIIQLISIIENGWLNLQDENVVAGIKKLREVIEKIWVSLPS